MTVCRKFCGKPACAWGSCDKIRQEIKERVRENERLARLEKFQRTHKLNRGDLAGMRAAARRYMQ